jgi:hypothetical protein
VLKARRPAAIERIGSMLGEEGGEDGTELDAVDDPAPRIAT